jgi:predicted naringenin-chalcone synthase
VPAYLRTIETVTPAYAYDQASVQQTMATWTNADRRTARLLGRIYPNSGIDTRHSVVPDFKALEADSVSTSGLFVTADGAFKNPSTGERNDRYKAEASPLFVKAARKALDASTFAASDVTHVVTVSCTGFYAPGPDLDVVLGLDLPKDTERYHLGFMGCYAAFPAMRLAKSFCDVNEDAVVLVIAVELCTLHLQPKQDTDSVISASVFADGAAGAVVSGQKPEAGSLELKAFKDALAPEGASDMAWTIGDTGFDMVLSAYVPAIVGEKAEVALAPLLDSVGGDLKSVDRWAVHPGGRAILDKVEAGLGLSDDALNVSREVLAENGNLSSVTILHVLKRVLADGGPAGERTAALAFGPGLTVATGLFERT